LDRNYQVKCGDLLHNYLGKWNTPIFPSDFRLRAIVNDRAKFKNFQGFCW